MKNFTRFFLYLPLTALLAFAACSKDDPKPEPTPPPTPAPAPEPEPDPDPEKYRTVLFYMMDDHNLWDYMETTINELEAGWDEQTDGNLLIYLDPSPKLTQFPTPVLLKVVHDETDAIRSEVVVAYPEQDPVDPVIMKGVLEDVIALYPAESHGLIIGTHGGAWFPANMNELISGSGHDEEEDVPNFSDRIQTKGLGGGERFGTDLEIDDLAELLPIKYDFLLFHACLMGNIETAYQLRNKCNLMIASMKPLPGYAYPYDEVTPYLFTKPQADFSHLVRNSVAWYDALPDQGYMEMDVSVIRTDKLDALAAATKTILNKLPIDIATYYAYLKGNTQYIDDGLPLHDLHEAIRIACSSDPELLSADYAVFEKALKAALPQQAYSARATDPKVLASEYLHGLSCYVPLPDAQFSGLNDAFKSYEWAAVSGFDKLIVAE